MEYNPDKPLYQWKGWPPPGNMWLGGKCGVVNPHLSIKQRQDNFDLLIRQREMQRGADMMYWGIIIALVCAVLHGCISTQKPLKVLNRFAEWGIVGGVLAIAAGIMYKKVTQYENWIALGLGVAIVGGFLYWKRDWSLSQLKLFKAKLK